MKKWIKESLLWSAWLTLGTGVGFPLLASEEIKDYDLTLRFAIFTVVGLLIGYFFIRKRNNKTIKS